MQKAQKNILDHCHAYLSNPKKLCCSPQQVESAHLITVNTGHANYSNGIFFISYQAPNAQALHSKAVDIFSLLFFINLFRIRSDKVSMFRKIDFRKIDFLFVFLNFFGHVFLRRKLISDFNFGRNFFFSPPTFDD